jgi:hypothetical protein
MALTCLLWIVVALTTRPDPEDTLVEFYRRSRPPGWWGPIARRAGVRETGRAFLLRGLGVAVLGMTAVAAGTIAFSSLYVARWSVAAVAVALCLLAGVAFRWSFRKVSARMNDIDVPA